MAAILGPELAKWTSSLLAVKFSATFWALSIITVIGFLLIYFGKFNIIIGEKSKDKTNRPMLTVFADKKFVLATTATSCSYFVMILSMVAAPLAMHILYKFSFSAIAFGIQLHFLGMFAPSLITGKLIKRFGLKIVMLAGSLSSVIALILFATGSSHLHFYLGLVFLGIGWNFLFIGGSALLTRCYSPLERDKIQAANVFITGIISAIGSLLSGFILNLAGWPVLNLLLLPFVILMIIMILIFIESPKK